MKTVNNVEIGIMMRVNELASRYGLEPFDFIAEYKDETVLTGSLSGEPEPTGNSVLSYPILPRNPSKLERFELMLETLGISNDSGAMIGSDEQIVKALNKALEVAPRNRARA
jgi:hypothetical protein